MTVDGEVHADVVEAALGSVKVTEVCEPGAGNVLKDKVVELVLEDTQLVSVVKVTHELRVVDQLELAGLGHGHASGWDPTVGALVDAPTDGREERLFHEQARGVHVEVELRRGRGGGGWGGNAVSHVNSYLLS